MAVLMIGERTFQNLNLCAPKEHGRKNRRGYVSANTGEARVRDWVWTD
jgi:hypothetical protein